MREFEEHLDALRKERLETRKRQRKEKRKAEAVACAQAEKDRESKPSFNCLLNFYYPCSQGKGGG